MIAPGVEIEESAFSFHFHGGDRRLKLNEQTRCSSTRSKNPTVSEAETPEKTAQKTPIPKQSHYRRRHKMMIQRQLLSLPIRMSVRNLRNTRFLIMTQRRRAPRAPWAMTGNGRFGVSRRRRTRRRPCPSRRSVPLTCIISGATAITDRLCFIAFHAAFTTGCAAGASAFVCGHESNSLRYYGTRYRFDMKSRRGKIHEVW